MILGRDAEHGGDDHHWQWPGHRLDEVELSTADQRIDRVNREPFDLACPRFHSARREVPRHDLAEPGVIGRIHREHHRERHPLIRNAFSG